MELIFSSLAALGAFLGAITAHFVAHDAYSKCPKYAHKLIQRAARMLPPLARRRYEEEWLADLQERNGVFAKLRHAFECLLCARKLGASVRPLQPIEITFGNGEKAKFNFATMVAILGAMACASKQVARNKQHGHTPDHRGIEEDLLVMLRQLTEKYSYLGAPDTEEFRKFSDAIERNLERENRVTDITGFPTHDDDLNAELLADFDFLDDLPDRPPPTDQAP